MKYKTLSKKLKLKEESKAEQDLMKKFALVSDMFDSHWSGVDKNKKQQRKIVSRDSNEDFSNDYYESMPVTDDSLWPNGSLIVVSLSEVGHTVATMLKKKDKLKRKGNIYLRGNRLSTLLKKENIIDGYKSILGIIGTGSRTTWGDNRDPFL